jgi:hypothetical protein
VAALGPRFEFERIRIYIYTYGNKDDLLMRRGLDEYSVASAFAPTPETEMYEYGITSILLVNSHLIQASCLGIGVRHGGNCGNTKVLSIDDIALSHSQLGPIDSV